MKLLIVDDSEMNRNLIRTYIDDFKESRPELDLQIDEAENGLVAFEKAQQEQYDIIFMDIMMPVMDGVEATKKIHELNHDAITIVISAADDDERKTQILENGASDYLAKPVDMAVFMNHLDHYTGEVLARQNG
jgi:CheY-like chemotaxis protein